MKPKVNKPQSKKVKKKVVQTIQDYLDNNPISFIIYFN
jgi:hypothetical protein